MQRPPPLQLPLQQSVLVSQNSLSPRQHLPPEHKTSAPTRAQHCVLSVQESPGCAHGGPQVRAGMLPAQLLLQHSLSPPQRSPSDPQHLPLTQLPLQQSSSAAEQELKFVRHVPQVPMRNPAILQILLQHSLSALQVPPFGWHIGVVEVVLVEVEVVGVVVEVLVEVLVVLLVEVLVEVVLVVVVVVPHGPGWSPWSRWRSTALWETSMVFSSGVPGLWQMVTFGWRARAREGISAAMAVPAKSLSALRRLIEPSARALARSSKERSVVCWLTCCPLFPKGGPLGD